MGLLNEIGLKHQTDKSSMTHCYLDNYEKYFSFWRDKEFVLLELGVAGGASIRTWREYFQKAKVYGVDNNPGCVGDGIFICSQTDKEYLDKIVHTISEPAHSGIDIIIDDGGHVGHETIKSFEILFPQVKSGGLYIIEDTSVWFNTHYSGDFQRNGRTEVYNFFSDLAYHVEVAGRGCCGNQDFAINHPTTEPPVPKYSSLLKAIHIYTGLWVFERK